MRQQTDTEHDGSVHMPLLHRNPLLHRYPILLPILLLGTALVLGSVSVFSDQTFPVLALFGVPSTLLCLSIALVLAIAATLIAIIGFIERLDRSADCTTTRAGTFVKAKGVEL